MTKFTVDVKDLTSEVSTGTLGGALKLDVDRAMERLAAQSYLRSERPGYDGEGSPNDHPIYTVDTLKEQSAEEVKAAILAAIQPIGEIAWTTTLGKETKDRAKEDLANMAVTPA